MKTCIFLLFLMGCFACKNKKESEHLFYEILSENLLSIADTNTSYKYNSFFALHSPISHLSRYTIYIDSGFNRFYDSMGTYQSLMNDAIRQFKPLLEKRTIEPFPIRTSMISNTRKFRLITYKGNKFEGGLDCVGLIRFDRSVIEKNRAIIVISKFQIPKAGVKNIYFFQKNRGKWSIVDVKEVGRY